MTIPDAGRRYFCAFNREDLPISATLTIATDQSEAEAVIFPRFGHHRSTMEALGVHVTLASVEFIRITKAGDLIDERHNL